MVTFSDVMMTSDNDFKLDKSICLLDHLNRLWMVELTWERMHLWSRGGEGLTIILMIVNGFTPEEGNPPCDNMNGPRIWIPSLRTSGLSGVGVLVMCQYCVSAASGRTKATRRLWLFS